MSRCVLFCLAVTLLLLTDAHDFSTGRCNHLERVKEDCDEHEDRFCNEDEVQKSCLIEGSTECEDKKKNCQELRRRCYYLEMHMKVQCPQNTEVKIALWRPSTGTWLIKGPGTGDYENSRFNIEIKSGEKGDIPVPRDYFHEGATRLASYSPSLGHWYIKGQGYKDYNASKGNLDIHFGGPDNIPVPGDYDGDGVMSLAVFNTTSGMWYIKEIGLGDWGNNESDIEIQYGREGDIPVPMDYFNQGRMNIAVFRPSNGMWFIKGSNMVNWAEATEDERIQFGQNGDIPVPGNYYGDGTVRLAVFTPTTGVWSIKESGPNDWDQSSANVKVQCGQAGDVPVPFDFFDEGRVRIAVWRPSNGNWYIKAPGFDDWRGMDGDIAIHAGQNGDVPIKISTFMT